MIPSVLVYSLAARQQAQDMMNSLAKAWAPRSVAEEPRAGDTLVLEGSAVMVMGLEARGFTGSEERVNFRARSGPLRQIWVDSVTEAAWRALVENWLEMGATVVPAESVEQIYPHRVDAGGFTGGVDEVGQFMAGFPAANRPARVSAIGGAG